MPSEALRILRSRISEIATARHESGPPLPTGIAPLDHQLKGGIHRGRITELIAPHGAGKTAILREVVAQALSVNQWVAWIDTRHTLAPAPWATLGKHFVVVRPGNAQQGTRAAEILLRSGIFSLVILDGASAMSRSICARLSRVAREKDAALVVTAESGTAGMNGTIRLKLTPGPLLAIRAHLHNHAHSAVEISRAAPSPLARSLRAHPEIPDRRGMAGKSQRSSRRSP